MKKEKLLFLYLCVAILALLRPSAVYARTQLETGRQGNITISYELPNAEFSLYRVADISENAEFTLVGDFAGYQVTLEGLDGDGWRLAAQTLETCVENDEISALASGHTDGQGKLVFADLDTGLYLVTGKTLVKDGTEYEPSSALVSFPNLDGDTWDYEPVISPKYETKVREMPSSETSTDETASTDKAEETDAAASTDKAAETDAAISTDTEEATGEAGSTDTEEETDEAGAADETTETDEDAEADSGGSTTGGNATGGGTTGGGSTSATSLPQTGQLWWPVPYMALAGMLLLIFGMLVRKREG